MAAVIENKPFTIDEWRVEPSLNRLSRADEVVKIDPQNMKVLELLASRPGEVISQAEIEQKAWAGVIVTPNSVYQSIAQLRRALGDNRANPRYIETIARKGYRLVAPVVEIRTANSRDEASLDDIRGNSKYARRHRRYSRSMRALGIALAPVATLLAAALGMQLYQNSAQPVADSILVDVGMRSDRWEREPAGHRAERLANLGASAIIQGRAHQAIAYYEHALALQREATGDHDPHVVEILATLASLYNWHDDHAQAEAIAREALHLAENLGSELDPRLIIAHDALTDVLLNDGRFAEAELHANRAIELSSLVYGDWDMKTAGTRYSLAVLRIHQGRAKEAETLLRGAFEVFIDKHGAQGPSTAHTRATIAIALYQQRRYEEGAEEAREAIRSLQQNTRPNHPYLGTAQQVLADCLNALAQYEEAERMSRASMELWKANDAKPWRVARAASSLAEALMGQQRFSEAEEFLSYASRVFAQEGSALQEIAADLHRQRVAKFQAVTAR